MSPSDRQRKIDAALAGLRAAETLLDEAQEFADCIGDRPDVDACLELSIIEIQQAAKLVKWSLSLLEDGVAAQCMP